MTSSARPFLRVTAFVALAIAAVVVTAGTASAQAAKSATTAKPAAKPAGKPAAKSLAGQWTGTVTVKLGDSTIVAPVFYTFTDSAGATAGTAMVPGQGTGPISNVVRTGDAIRFRVTAKQAEKIRLLEHGGTLGADGVLDGMVMLEGKPVAKFRIAPKK